MIIAIKYVPYNFVETLCHSTGLPKRIEVKHREALACASAPLHEYISTNMNLLQAEYLRHTIFTDWHPSSNGVSRNVLYYKLRTTFLVHLFISATNPFIHSVEQTSFSMIKEFLKGLLLSLLLATLSALAVPTVSEPSLDACGSLDTKQGVNLTYADVANCYKSIPFDSKLAASTMETVLTFVNDHYSFRDYALTPNLKSPFSSPPVDIMKQLQLVGTDKYSNDFSFHTALSTTFNKLYDAHAGYDGKPSLISFLIFAPQFKYSLTRAIK